MRYKKGREGKGRDEEAGIYYYCTIVFVVNCVIFKITTYGANPALVLNCSSNSILF